MYEELIKRLREKASRWCINCCYREGDCICAAPDYRKKDCDICSKLEAADAIEALSKKEKTTHWIPVTERLPGKDTRVIVCASLPEGVHSDFIYEDGHWFVSIGVTHWMPLPEPPKDESLDNSEPETKQEYYHAFCSRCGRPVIAKKEEAFWWPGGTTDDHLCISCDVCGGLAEV